MALAHRSLLALSAGLVGLAGCTPRDAPKPPPDPPSVHQELLEVAASYRAWGRVDKEMHAAILDCRAPVVRPMDYSDSSDADTHGQKFYALYAKDPTEYLGVKKDNRVSVGQAIVKETWRPVAKGEKEPAPLPDPMTPDLIGNQAIRKDGKSYTAGQPAGLFVMIKFDPKTEGTDNGWVYGTLSADGKEVTAAGKVESCMKCHQDAKHDRLFALSR